MNETDTTQLSQHAEWNTFMDMNKNFLSQNMDVSLPVLNKLEEKKIISTYTCKALKNVSLEYDRACQLLETLKKYGPTCLEVIIEIFDEECQKRVVECFQTFRPNYLILFPKSLRYNVKEPGPGPFVGREDDLKYIKDFVANIPKGKMENSVARSTLVIHGMCRSGKTTLVRHYVKQVTEFINVAWIPAQTEDTLVRHFQNLSEELRMPDLLNLKIEKVVQRVYAHFLTQKTLLVFEDVKCNSGISRFLPELISGTHTYPVILFTSTHSNWQQFTSNYREIGFLPTQACEIYIKKRLLDFEDVEQNWELLASFCNNLISPMESIINYVGNYHLISSIDELLQYFHDDCDEELKEELCKQWELPLKELESYQTPGSGSRGITTSTITMLNTLSFLSSTGIPHKLIEELNTFPSLRGTDIIKAVHILYSQGFIVSTRKHKIVYVDKFLQMSQIKTMTNKGSFNKVFRALCQNYHKALPSSGNEHLQQYYADNARAVYTFLSNHEMKTEFSDLLLQILAAYNSHDHFCTVPPAPDSCESIKRWRSLKGLQNRFLWDRENSLRMQPGVMSPL